jgi:iron complex transport system substrate-binding protein
LPAVGSSLTPAFERIAALRPTHILLDASAGNQVEALRALAPVEVLPWLTVDEVVSSTRRLGALSGRVEAAEVLAHRLARLRVAPGADAPRVLLVLGDGGMPSTDVWFIRRNSLHGAALQAAGARNAVDEDVPGQPVLSVEALLKLDPPTVIVLSTAPASAEFEARVKSVWSAMTPLRAVRDGRVAVVSGPGSLSTGPTILGTVESLRAALERLGSAP